MKLLEEQSKAEKQFNQIKHERDQLSEEYQEHKQKLEIQLGELNTNLLQVRQRSFISFLSYYLSFQVSESLSDTNIERERLEKQTVKNFLSNPF